MVVFWFSGCVTLVLIYVFANIAARVLPNRLPEAGQHPGRIGYIDGLRGYLALAVVAHHFAIQVQLRKDGFLDYPPNAFLRNVGPVAVILFFMITAVLFYGKLLRSDGRLDIRTFYKGRAVRLFPAFLAALFASVVYGFVNGQSLHDTGAALDAASLLNWLTFSFFGGYTPLFGIQIKDQLGMVWSLRYEWAFYAVLPIVAYAVLKLVDRPALRLASLIVVLAGSQALSFVQIHGFNVGIASAFIWGMLIVELKSSSVTCRLMSRGSVGFICLTLLLIGLCIRSSTYSLYQYITCFTFLFCVCLSNPAFKLLNIKSCIVLGDASYGIYLFHLISIYVALSIYESKGGLPADYTVWLVLIAASIITVIIAILFYYAVEYPAILRGRPKRGRDGRVRELEQAAP